MKNDDRNRGEREEGELGASVCNKECELGASVCSKEEVVDGSNKMGKEGYSLRKSCGL